MIDSQQEITDLLYSNVETNEPATAMKASGLLFYIKAAALPEIVA